MNRFTAVRKFTYEASLEYFENGAGQVESRQETGLFRVEFVNSDQLTAEVNANYDLLQVPFSPSLPTLQGGTVEPWLFTLRDKEPDLKDPKLTLPINKKAINGVLHTIDRVLIPLDLLLKPAAAT